MQKTESSSSLPSSSTNTAEVKIETSLPPSRKNTAEVKLETTNLDAGVNYNWVTLEDAKAIDAPQVQHASSVIAPISSSATFPSSGTSAWQDPQPSLPSDVGQTLTNQLTPPPVGVLNTQACMV